MSSMSFAHSARSNRCPSAVPVATLTFQGGPSFGRPAVPRLCSCPFLSTPSSLLLSSLALLLLLLLLPPLSLFCCVGVLPVHIRQGLLRAPLPPLSLRQPPARKAFGAFVLKTDAVGVADCEDCDRIENAGSTSKRRTFLFGGLSCPGILLRSLS